ncbi:hypothetical protein J8J40_21695 [Mycobacterium tuberculosis]|nr:hypothetical protein [Mycobacterium tuberculosis]MBP0649660.1 hypothetical protein [Mycobacterium tuberculosis]
MGFGENGSVTAAPPRLTPAEVAARRQRSIAIGLALALMVGVFYVLTIVKLAGGR